MDGSFGPRGKYIQKNLTVKRDLNKISLSSNTNHPKITQSSSDFLLDDEPPRRNKKDAVYFNSNSYLGNEYIDSSPDKGSVNNSCLVNEYFLSPDVNQIILDAEKRLLQCMVNFRSARLAMKQALSNGMGNEPSLFSWSTPEKEWLFQQLIDSQGNGSFPNILQDGGTVAQLRQHLADQPDAPAGSFTTKPSRVGVDYVDICLQDEKEGKNLTNITSLHESGELPQIELNFQSTIGQSASLQEEQKKKFNLESNFISTEEDYPSSSSESSAEGSLEVIFSPKNEFLFFNLSDASVSHEIRAELTVQQTVSVMLRATAIKRLSRLKKQWKVALDALSATKKGGIENSDTSKNEELETICNTLGHKVTEASKTVHDLTESSRTLNDRLLDYCSSNDVEGRISKVKVEKLAKMMESHIASLPPDTHRPDSPGDDGDYIFGSDDFHNNVDPTFGGRDIDRSGDL